MEDHFGNVIHLDLIQGICCKMFCSLLQITDSCGISVFFNDRIQSVRCYLTLFFLKAHPFQHLGKSKFRENNLLLLIRIIRNVNHCKTGHQRS